MKPEDILDALFADDAALTEDEALAALLAVAGRARRAQQEADLPHGEWQDGLHFDEEEARGWAREDLPALRLAASPATDGEPVRYGAEGWTVALSQRPDGGWSALLAGPVPATLALPGMTVPLTPRSWTELRVLAPPTLLTLRLLDGKIIILQRLDRSV